MKQRKGYDALWLWFGLGRASYLTLPRVLMHEMPDKWQGEMARLLREYDEEFPNKPELGSKVFITDMAGKLVKTPDWLINYRHPDYNAIGILRQRAAVRTDAGNATKGSLRTTDSK